MEDKASKESIEYRKLCREGYLREKREELIKEWKKRDQNIFWDKYGGKRR